MFKNYLLTAYKVFMRRKLFTAINLLCISITLMVLLVLTAVLQNTFQPSGVEGKSDRFLQTLLVATKAKNGNGNRNSPLGYKLITQYLQPLTSVEMVSAVTFPETVSVYQDDKVSQLMIRHADANYWKILDFNVLAGRVPNVEDVDQGRFVVVLNQSTAEKLFGNAAALAQKINISGRQFEVIGVVEDVLQLNSYADLWVPLTTSLSSDYQNKYMGTFAALLLAKSAADIPLIQAEVAQVAATATLDDPVGWPFVYFWADTKLDFFARMLLGNNDSADSGASTLLLCIGGLMLLFMLLPALNLVNLNTGRIMERYSEIGVRKAFGASSAQLVYQLLIENVLLCLVGAVLGLIGAKLALLGLEHSGLIPYFKVVLNWHIFGYGLLITLIFGLLSGILPAWKMSRLDPVYALKGAR